MISVLLLPILLLSTLMQSVGAPENLTPVEVKYSLPAKGLSLHEPVVVQVEIQNRTTEPVTVKLGANYETGFVLILTPPNGSPVRLQNVPPRYMSAIGTLGIQPGDAVERRLVLNEWYDFDSLGKYQLEARIVEPLTFGKNSFNDTGFRGSFEIGPRDAVRLRAACEHLVSILRNTETVSVTMQAATELASINDTMAIPYIQQAMEQQNAESVLLAQGLVKIGNDAAVEALLAELHSKYPATSESARFGLQMIQGKISNPNLRETVKRTLSN